MKKYYLTRDLLEELLYGTKSNKQKIVSRLEDLLKKNESLFVSLVNINHILEKENNLETRKLILKNLDLVCEKMLFLDKSQILRNRFQAFLPENFVCLHLVKKILTLSEKVSNTTRNIRVVTLPK